jgi:uncharacterized glyoxalase superfamily protein PhnB
MSCSIARESRAPKPSERARSQSFLGDLEKFADSSATPGQRQREVRALEELDMATKKNVSKKQSSTKDKPAKKAINPIPRGYRTVTAALNQADASATIAFCKKAFGAKLRSKMSLPGGKLMHSEIEIGDAIIMVSDAMRDPALTSSLFLYVPKVDKTVAKAVKAGARVLTPPTDMFWGDRFARVEDPQGNLWAIASRVEVVKPDALKKRMKAAAKEMAASMA